MLGQHCDYMSNIINIDINIILDITKNGNIALSSINYLIEKIE